MSQDTHKDGEHEPRRGAIGRRLRLLRKVFNARLRNYFFAGLLVVAPISITVWLAWTVVDFFDNTVRRAIPAAYSLEDYLPMSIPGLGLVLFLVGVTVIGWLAAGIVGRAVIRMSERIVGGMPVVRNIYAALKQIFETVLKQKSTAFRQVVLVEYPRRGIWCLAFVSGRTEGEVQDLTDDEMINVFLPTTPNPTSGFLLFFPRRDVIVLDMTVEEGIKMVVSGGIVTPKRPGAALGKPKVALRDATQRVIADEEAARIRRSEREGATQE